MHFFKGFALTLLCIFLQISFSHAAETKSLPKVSIPINSSNWMLCDPLLPYGQQKIYIMSAESNGEEFISVEFLPLGEKAELRGVCAAENAKIYTTQHLLDKTLIALEDDQYFKIHVHLQGKLFLYNICFASLAADLSEEARYAWIERFGKITESPYTLESALTVTPFTVVQNNAKIKVISETKNYADSSKNFSLTVPVSWIVNETESKFTNESDFIIHRNFCRRDNLITGTVATTRYLLSKKPTDEEIQNDWRKTIKEIRNQIDLITEGPITNINGVKGNYMVIRVDDGSLHWQAFYLTQHRIYLLTAIIHGKNFKATRKEIFNILKHFSFLEELPEKVEGTDQKSKEIV